MNEELISGAVMDKKDTKVSKKSKKTNFVDSNIKFSDLEGKLLLVKIGSEKRSATDAELNNLQKKITKEIERKGINCLVLVAGHTVTAQIIEKQK